MSARKDEKSSPLSPEGDTGAKSPLSAGAFSAAGSANELPSIPSPDTQPDIEPERAEPARIEPPLQGSYRSFEPVRAAQPRSTIATTTLRFSRREDAPEVEMTADDDSAAAASARRRRFALLAASVALAAAFGAGAGALGAWSLTPEPPAPPPAPVVAAAVPDTKPLQKTIAQLRAEVTSLRSSVESANRNTTAQFSKTSDRLDRIERAQADPATKLNKAVEVLDRIDKRTDNIDKRTDTPPKDTTGSINPPTQIASVPPQPQPQVQVQGWIVRDVSRGVALLQGRLGLVEVEPGDIVPGLGRIDSIRRQDGHWVVITARGVIGTAR